MLRVFMKQTVDFTPTREFFRRLPKAELHVHLDGSLRAETLLSLADAAGVAVPAKTPEQVRQLVQPPEDEPSLVKYLQAFDVLCSVLTTPEAMHRVTRELLEDLSADGVRYAEIRYSPRVLPASLDPHAAIEAVGAALVEAEAHLPIAARQILCVMRHEDPAHGEDVARLAVAHTDDGVVALDIAGAEAGNPPTEHRAAFDFARAHGLHATVHAGEAGPAEYVRDAFVHLGAERVGHGTHLPDDDAILELIADQQVCVEACITSNVQTGALQRPEDHPLPQFLGAGVPVTLSTDNVTVSGVLPSEEYARAHQLFDLRADALATLALTGFHHAFLPIHERRRQVQAMESLISELLTSA